MFLKKNGIILFLFLFIGINSVSANEPLPRDILKLAEQKNKINDYSPVVSEKPVPYKFIISEIKNSADTIQEKKADSQKISQNKYDSDNKPEFSNVSYVYLGDKSDNHFYFDTNVIYLYEKNGFEKTDYKLYKSLFTYILELINKNLNEQVITETDDILKKKIFINERLKLNFIKAYINNKLKNSDKLKQDITEIENLDTQKKYIDYTYFYKAKLAELSDDTNSALKEYLKIPVISPDSIITDDALLNIALLYTKTQEFDKALNYLDIIISKYPESDKADNALFLKAELYDKYDKNRNFGSAEYNYRILYKIYPKSEYAVQAQKRAEEIRKNFL